MRLALIGVGQAGGKIVDAFLEYERRSDATFVAGSIVVNTAKADLLGLEYVPVENRLLIGVDRVKGHGVGADNELGAEVAEEDVQEVLEAVNAIGTSNVDAFLVVAGLGGGTGSGGSPVIARELKRLYTEPVYGLGALPSRDEGGLYTLNAARSLQTFVREVDNLVLFDNEAWRESGETLALSYEHINSEIARRLGVLFSAGETSDGDVAETIVDASEIINTLASGGITTVGYATADVARPPRSLRDRLSGKAASVDETESLTRITSVVRMAALGRLSLPCEIDSAERALVLVAGPSAYLSRKGIERSRNWLEEQTGSMEVRGGDYPVPDSDYVAAVVLLSGVTNVPRIKELQRVAIETQQTIGEISAQSEAAFDELVWGDGSDELEPLF